MEGYLGSYRLPQLPVLISCLVGDGHENHGDGASANAQVNRSLGMDSSGQCLSLTVSKQQ